MKIRTRVCAVALGVVLGVFSVTALAMKPNPYLCDYGTVGSWLCEQFGGIYCDMFCV